MNYYDKDNIQSLVLPQTPLTTLAKDYWVPLIEQGIEQALKQVKATCGLVVIHEKIIPILINEDSEHCSLISPSCYFFLSGTTAYSKHKNPLFKILFQGIKLFKAIPRALNFDRCIHINQWLLPSNPLISLTKDELNDIINFLKAKYPDHAIVLKGITKEYSESMVEAALSLGARLIKMRWLYFWDSQKITQNHRRKLKSNNIEFEKTLDHSESNRIRALYDQLYREKHSPYSPEYTPYFFERLIGSNFFNLAVLRNNNQIDAFYFHSDNGPFLQLGIVGYDTKLPQELAIYPSLTKSATALSEKSQNPISLGAGSGQFKRQRGAYPINEYDACFVSHLPWSQRLFWVLFSTCTQAAFMDLFIKDV